MPAREKLWVMTMVALFGGMLCAVLYIVFYVMKGLSHAV